MSCIVRAEHWDISTRLRQLDLTLDECLSVVDAAFGAAAGCTAADVPSARGTLAYLWATRHFRLLKSGTDGWEKSDDGNFSTIVNHHLKLRIAAVNTSDGTGRLDGFPRNKSEKGTNSKAAVLVNRLPMFPDLAPSPRNPLDFEERSKRASVATYPTWYLCLYFSSDGGRAELSQPVGIDDDGYFYDWKERIFLIDDNGPVRAPLTQQESTQVTVSVRRRA